jgi:thiol:disulfide interchange protein DsbD
VAGCALLAAFCAPVAFGQQHARAKLFVRADRDDVKVAVQIQLDPGWHVYHGPTEADLGGPGAVGQPTTVTMEGDGFEWSAPRFPEPEREEQEFGATKTWILEHFGSPVIYLRGRRTNPSADPSSLRARVQGLTCDPAGCVPYKETVQSGGRGSDRLFEDFPADLLAPGAAPAAGGGSPPGGASADPNPSVGEPGAGGSAGSDPAEPPPNAGSVLASRTASGARETKQLALGAFLLSAVLAGLFALLMPCTYPMIPITISYFTKQASASHRSMVPLALCYGAGIVLVFVAIGVAVGSAIIWFAANPWFNLAVGIAFVYFALVLFGVVLLQPPQFMMEWVGQATRRGGVLGVFLLGTLLAVTSFTCTVPFVGGLLGAGGAGGNLSRVVLGMGTFGLTMAVPFVFLALVPGRVKAMPRSGEWMHTLKVTLGFVELAAALKFISNADLVWRWQVLPRELFLVLWFGILLLAALYLFGVIRLKEEGEPAAQASHAIGPGRLLWGSFFFLFALYCLYGGLGNRMDRVMETMAPIYSRPFALAAGAGNGDDPTEEHAAPILDDYERARDLAKARHRPLLINFTGFT